jgi:molybdopterin-guanine dinucleotide biosynthesis protein A
VRVGGIVLCGGESLRMGRPKAWLPVGGEMMLGRVVRLLREAVEPVVVVAAPGQDVPPLPGDVAVVPDEIEGRGPLQGLAAGLAALEGQVDAAYLSACDVPLLRRAFVRRMIDLLGETAACVPTVGGLAQPLAGVYRVSVLGAVRELLAEDRRAVWGLLDRVPTRRVLSAELTDVDPRLDSLRNVNTPAAYAGVLKDLVSGGRQSPLKDEETGG